MVLSRKLSLKCVAFIFLACLQYSLSTQSALEKLKQLTRFVQDLCCTLLGKISLYSLVQLHLEHRPTITDCSAIRVIL